MAFDARNGIGFSVDLMGMFYTDLRKWYDRRNHRLEGGYLGGIKVSALGVATIGLP